MVLVSLWRVSNNMVLCDILDIAGMLVRYTHWYHWVHACVIVVARSLRATSPRAEGWAYKSGKSQVHMLQVLCNT